MQTISFLANKFEIHSPIVWNVGDCVTCSLWGLLGWCPLPSGSPYLLLHLLDGLRLKKQGQNPQVPFDFQESGMSFQYRMLIFSLESRGHNLLRVGRAAGRISYFTPGSRLKPFYKLCPKSMVNDCGENKWITEVLKLKKQNKNLR